MHNVETQHLGMVRLDLAPLTPLTSIYQCIFILDPIFRWNYLYYVKQTKRHGEKTSENNLMITKDCHTYFRFAILERFGIEIKPHDFKYKVVGVETSCPVRDWIVRFRSDVQEPNSSVRTLLSLVHLHPITMNPPIFRIPLEFPCNDTKFPIVPGMLKSKENSRFSVALDILFLYNGVRV